MNVDRNAPINYQVRMEEGVHVVRLDLSGHPKLADAKTANKTLQRILTQIYGQAPTRLDTLIVRATAVSGSSIMGLPEKAPACLYEIARTLKVLDFSRTNLSANAFSHLPEFLMLEEAYFDGCPNVDLENMQPHASLRVLSLTGTKVSVTCLRQLLANFPKLEQLDCTIDLDEQAPVGFKDAVNFARPLLNTSCGHFSTKKEPHACEASGKHHVTLNHLSVRMSKVEQQWQVLLLDVSKQPIGLNQPLFLHEPCGKLYSQIAAPNADCTECKTPINTHLYPINQERTSTVNLFYDFDRLSPNTPYKILQIALKEQAKYGF